MATVSAPKIDIDTVTKILTVTQTPVFNGTDFIVNFDIQIDLYSDLKEVWVSNEVLRKLRFPVRAVGGDPLPGSKVLGDTYFLDPEWKIRPYESNHRFIVNGNFYSEDGTSPYVQTVGSYNILLEQQVSNLVDSTVAQLAEIEYASFQDVVTIDITSSYSGTAYPIGTRKEPVNNLTDALLISQSRGFNEFYVIGNLTIVNEDVSGYIFRGQTPAKSTIVVLDAAQTLGCEFENCTLAGILDGNAQATRCAISSLTYIAGGLTECFLMDWIIMGGTTALNIINCVSGIAGPTPVIIDCGGDAGELSVRNYSGGLHIINKTGADAISLDISQGNITLDSTVTNGEIVCRGVGRLTNNATGTAVVYEDMLSPTNLNKALFTNGQVFFDSSSSFSGTLFPKGTTTQPVNNLADALSIANAQGLSSLNIRGTCVATASHNLDGFQIIGDGQISNVLVLSGASTDGVHIDGLIVAGNADGIVTIYNSVVGYTGLGGLTGFQGLAENCIISHENGIVLEAAGIGGSLRDCSASIAGNLPAIIDFNGNICILDNATGNYLIKNMTAATTSTISVHAGEIELDSSCTAGTLVFRGTGHVTNNGTTIVEKHDLLSNSNIASQVRTELTPELTKIDQIHTLSSSQQTMVLEMYRLMGLDPTKPLVVTPTTRDAGVEISQSIDESGNVVTVTRLP